MLERIAGCMTHEARKRALQDYITERERRRRHAAVRDERDRERRTLVGAHMNKADAEIITKLADLQDLSVTAFVKKALENEIRRTPYFTEHETPKQTPAAWTARTVERGAI